MVRCRGANNRVVKVIRHVEADNMMGDEGELGRTRGGYNSRSSRCRTIERDFVQQVPRSTSFQPQHVEDAYMMGDEGPEELGMIRGHNSGSNRHTNEKVGQEELGNRCSIRASNSIETSSPNMHLDEDTNLLIGKRKRVNKFTGRVAMALNVNEVLHRCEIEERPQNNFMIDEIEYDEQQRRGSGHISAHSAINATTENGEATSKKTRGQRGKYKSYVADMKIKGKQSKLKIYIPNEIDRAIGENARHLVNECGRIVRTKAPLNVNNWQAAFTVAGDSMWKEIQRLYRLWKARLHYYYKSDKCGQTNEERLKNPPPDLPLNQWEYCVKRFGSDEFKAMSERNSKNCKSNKRSTHTTGNLSFAESEDILTKENNNVKPTANIIWLAQHTHKNQDGVLEWADNQSKEIHEKLKDVVAISGDTKSQEDILLEVLPARSGYFRGKGTTIRPFTKGRQQIHQQQIMEKQQEKIQQQDQRIKELEKAIEESQENQQKQFESYKEKQQHEMESFKQQMLEQFASLRNVPSL